MNRKYRWFSLTVAMMLFAVASLLLSNAVARQHRVASNYADSTNGVETRVGINAVTGFTFSTQQALTHAPIPAVSPCPVPSPNPLGLGCPAIKDQDIEPEIKVDIFGNIYVTAIHGYPGGVDLLNQSIRATVLFIWGSHTAPKINV